MSPCGWWRVACLAPELEVRLGNSIRTSFQVLLLSAREGPLGRWRARVLRRAAPLHPTTRSRGGCASLCGRRLANADISTSGSSTIGRGLRNRLKPSCRYNGGDRGVAHADSSMAPPSRGPSARRRISSGREPALRKPWDLVNSMKGDIVGTMLPFISGHVPHASPPFLIFGVSGRLERGKAPKSRALKRTVLATDATTAVLHQRGGQSWAVGLAKPPFSPASSRARARANRAAQRGAVRMWGIDGVPPFEIRPAWRGWRPLAAPSS